MSELRNPYRLTLSDLRRYCRLLDEIEITDWGIIGKCAGETVVRQKASSITPRAVEAFRNSYQLAVSAGIIKPSIPTQQEP